MRLSANLSILFKDVPFLERVERAAAAGFDAVEFWWPPEDVSPQDVAAAVKAADVDVALFNFYAGDMPAGDRGLLSDPARQGEFRANVPVALELAERVGCTRINALVGTALAGVDRSQQLALARQNVAWAAELAAAAGVEILVEAVNTFENGPYLLHRTDQALAFIDAVQAPNVAYQYDVYHMQRMEGNVAATLRTHAARIAHVQIADSPGRGEPGTGELNFAYLFEVLEEIGYDGHVGLEYVPTTDTTEQSLAWIERLLPALAPGQRRRRDVRERA
ncbi:MAG: hydroxypyruvate isomerase [Solirubrobacteraceae bacterium]|jgi:hydroxypyruvate isomerase|nr:hydroxypyruvate isomerase [Solirubrobacteraceae bacterium]